MIRTAYQDRIANLLDLTAPLPESIAQGPLLPKAPIHRAPRHPARCECETCWNAGQRYADYAKQKRLEAL